MVDRTDERVEQLEREIVDVVRRHSYAPEIAVVALADLAGGLTGQCHLQIEDADEVLRVAFARVVGQRVPPLAAPRQPR